MTQQPNFLFIITDQHRADHLGCYGNSVVRTPCIDAIAANGTRYSRFYVANPICMPNRASIMTGRMSSLHGARHNGIPLSLEQTTFVELLREAGYNTGLIGKSHLQSFTGLPATTVSGSTSRVTTDLAPTIERSPIVTPLRINAPCPSQTSSPIKTGRTACDGVVAPLRRSIASIGCPSKSLIRTPPAIKQ